jgi:hypothetical protein
MSRVGTVTGRIAAGLGGLVVVVLAGVLFLFVGVMSEEGPNDTNALQALLGLLAVLALVTTAVFSFVYAFGGNQGGTLLVVLCIAVVLVGLWILGLGTWCSGCGAS